MDECRVAADEIDSDCARRGVDRLSQDYGISARGICKKRNGRDGNAFVGDANSDFITNLIDRANQMSRRTFNLRAHTLSCGFHRV